MALDFGQTKGKAVKNKIDAYVMQDGENVLRMVGGILPRYVYWLKGKNNKDIPVECLAFNRDKERFDNKVEDVVPKYYPDLKCTWAYSINCIDPKDGKVKVFNLKKKLLEQIQTAAEDLGDPTDPDEGWDIVFKKVKTGSHAFNVEYTLSVLRCKKRALSEEERAAVAAAESIDTKYPRPTPEDIEAFITTLNSIEEGEDQTTGNVAEREAIADLT